MVFRIQPNGQLQFKETAVQDSLRGGEHRAADRAFAQLFSRNILEQGFAEAARNQQTIEEAEASAETQPLLNREALRLSIRSYLETKDNHPDAVVLIRAGDFYETYLADAPVLADSLELVYTSITSGDPTVGRVPAAGFPVHTLGRYLSQLTQAFTVALVEDDQAIIIHPQQTSTQIDTSSAEAQELSLFDVNSFTSTATDYRLDTAGYDPSWAALAKQPPSKPDSPTPAVSVNPVPQPNLKELADQVREFDLESVAASLGLEQDRHDRHKWRNGDQIISISNGKFMDWLADRGGGGAIDLVMHVQAVEFKAAVEWLSGQSCTAAPRQPQPESDKPHLLEMPTPNERRWPGVRDYLVEARSLPAALVDRLHQRHLIYADAMQNAVFVRHATSSNRAIWQRGTATGASLRGTWGDNNSFHGLAAGSAREQGWFWIGAGQGEVKRVMLTESPIDALSLATLDKRRSTTAGVSIYLSADGAGAVPIAALKQVLEQGGQVGVAFDADPAGEIMAWRVAQELPGVGRITPACGKDWNERLVFDGRPEQASQPDWDKQTLDALWQWHRVAQQLGKSPNYLNRITEVGREVVKGIALPERAKAAMDYDLQESMKQQSARLSLQDLRTVQGKPQKYSIEIDS